MTRFVAVTGAAGFIGQEVVRQLLKRGDYVYAVDRLDYAADFDSLPRTSDGPHLMMRTQDVRTLGRLPDVDAVIHLAASTHVDNSLAEGEEFVANNVGSTAKLCELVRAKAQHGMPHFVHVSTDEVYGPVWQGRVNEDAPLNPSSPYAASKAAAEHVVRAWGLTYKMPFTILRPTNCFGLDQYPEKLVPKTIRNCTLGRAMTIHGDGTQKRQWLATDDLARAILLVLDHRLEGTYNVGGTTEASVNDVVAAIYKHFNDIPQPQLGFARPACDLRYAVDDAKLRKEGWEPRVDLWDALPRIVEHDSLRFRF